MSVAICVPFPATMTAPRKQKADLSAEAPVPPEPTPQDLLPKPERLRHYLEIGGPPLLEKVVDASQAYGAHRRKLQTDKQARDYELQKQEQSLQRWAQIFAFMIGLSAIVGGLSACRIGGSYCHRRHNFGWNRRISRVGFSQNQETALGFRLLTSAPGLACWAGCLRRPKRVVGRDRSRSPLHPPLVLRVDGQGCDR